jgi:predicted transcriptional regulator
MTLYFKEKDIGFALKIDDLNVFEKPVNTDDLDNFLAPQSFKYLDEEEFEKILQLTY